MSESDKEKYESVFNYNIFCVSLMELCLICIEQSNYIEKNLNLTEKMLSRHIKLRDVCNKLINGMKLFDDDNKKSEYNMYDIIKKFYKVLYENFDLLKGADEKSDHNIFKLKNSENMLITLIPGVDLSLISKSFQVDSEQNKFWGFIYVMFIASIKMTSNANKKKITEERVSKLKNMIKILQKRVNSYGMSSDKKLFNPYFGINITSDGDTMSLEDMFSSIEPTNANIVESMMKNFSIDQYINVDSLNDQLRNIKESDLKITVDAVSKILNVGDNEGVRANLGIMIGELVKDLKENGVSNIFETTKKLSENLKEKLDPKSMQDTCGLMTDLINNGEERMKSLINESCPQTAETKKQNEELLKKFSVPMKYLKSFLPDQSK